MRLRKIMCIFVLAVFVLSACGKETEKKKEPTRTEQTENKEDSTDSSEDKDSQSVTEVPNDDEVQEPGNQTESNENQSNKNESTSNKNETTTKPSTGNTDSNKKPSTGSTGNSGSTNGGSTGNTQNNNGGTATQPSTPVHEHTWVEITKTVDVAEVGHYEDIYDWRTLCGKCGTDLTDMTADDRLLHVTIECRSGYSTHYIKVGEKWVVDTPASTKQEVTGYKCECGATKNK